MITKDNPNGDHLPIIQLKPGRERSLNRRHPWIFSGAIADIQGAPVNGETVNVIDSRGNFVVKGAYSPHSQIRVRAWSWNPEENIDRNFIQTRLQRAIASRREIVEREKTNAVRLVYGEADGLPGLVVDQYDETLVLQILSCGAEMWRETIIDILLILTNVKYLFERSDVDLRKLEGLPLRKGTLRDYDPPSRIIIRENKFRYFVDVKNGQKTGFFLDQRNNRNCVRELAKGREVLDCFAYTGGFTINALSGGATTVMAVDSSVSALELGSENIKLNNLSNNSVDWQLGDVFKVLRSLRDQNRSFDLIVLDPPKFAPTFSRVKDAARGYKDINLLALKLLRSSGYLVTFSCSGGISVELFQKIIAGAALDAGVNAKIIGWLHQSPDHPVALNFPEGEYLKGLVLKT